MARTLARVRIGARVTWRPPERRRAAQSGPLIRNPLLCVSFTLERVPVIRIVIRMERRRRRVDGLRDGLAGRQKRAALQRGGGGRRIYEAPPPVALIGPFGISDKDL